MILFGDRSIKKLDKKVIFDPNHPIELHTDAISRGYGAILIHIFLFFFIKAYNKVAKLKIIYYLTV